MNDLDWMAGHTWDIGEQIGGEDGFSLTDIAILLWDVRAELMAGKGV